MTDPTSPAEPAPLGDAARLLVEAAQAEAAIIGHSFVGTEHLLLALMADPALAAAAVERGFPERDELRRRLGEGTPPRAPAEGGGGLSSHARRLLEQAERAAGGVAIDRRWVLDRLVSSPRGPLARMVSRPEAAPKPAEAPKAAEPGNAPEAALAPGERKEERTRKPREDRRKAKADAPPASPRGAEKGRERPQERKPREARTKAQEPSPSRAEARPAAPAPEREGEGS